MINATVLFLTYTDQQKWGFSGKMCIDLNCVYDLDDNWYGPMCQVFTNVLRYDTFRGANIGGICQANREIIEIAETYHPKYVIYPCNYSSIVTEGTLLTLRKIGCIVVGYFFDDDEYFETKSRWMVPYIDYFISTGDTRGGIVEAYKNVGGRCILGVPLPTNPAIFCKQKGVEKLYNATFVGAMKANRLEYIEKIAGYGADVKYLGGGHWQKVHFSQMVKIYNQSRINLNFSSLHTNLSHNARRILGRVFEIVLSGGFLLTEYASGIENYFEVGSEIVCFDNAREAAEKIKYYLKHSDEREQIAECGYKKAQRDYTGQIRINKVFSEIEDDVLKHGRPELIPPKQGSENTVLHQNDAYEYFKWACALRKSPPPLRNEWYATTELVLNTNPQHKEAKRLLLRAKRWGYPEPLLIRLFVATARVFISIYRIFISGVTSIFRIFR